MINDKEQGVNFPPAKYFILEKDSRIYINDFVKIAVINEKGRFISINEDALCVLKLCNGKNNYFSIIEHLNSNRKKRLTKNEEQKVKLLLQKFSDNYKIINILDEPKYFNISSNIFDSNKSIAPFRYHIELTSKCNLSCSFCYKSCNDVKKVDMINPISVLEILKNNGVAIIEITGGEPLLHPDIYEVLEYAVKNFLHTSILSNGILLNDKLICLLNSNKDRITLQIDLQSINEKRYLQITKNNYLSIVLRNLEKLSKTNIKWRIVNVVIDEQGIDELEEIIKYAIKFNAKGFAMSPAIESGRGVRNISENFNIKFVNKLDKLYNEYGSFLNIIDQEIKNENKALGLCNCGLGYLSMVIEPMAKLRPCVFFKQHKSFDRLEDIEYRKLLSKLPSPNKQDCMDCMYKDFCVGCIYNGFVKYQEIKEKCSWGENYKLNEIIYD